MLEKTAKNPKGAGRKATGIKRQSLCISGQPEQLDKLKKLATESGMTVSKFIFIKTGIIES